MSIISGSKVWFYAVPDKEACNAFDANESCCAPIIQSFVSRKMKPMVALEDLYEKANEFKFSEAIDNLEINGSGWVYDWVARMSINLRKDEKKGEGSFIEILAKCSSNINCQSKNDREWKFLCISEHVHSVKVNARGATTYETNIKQW